MLTKPLHKPVLDSRETSLPRHIRKQVTLLLQSSSRTCWFVSGIETNATFLYLFCTAERACQA